MKGRPKSPRLSSACRLVLSLIKVAANLKLDLRSSKQLISSRSHARSSSSPNAMTTELRLGKISRVAHHNNLGKAIELRSLRSSTRHTDLGSSLISAVSHALISANTGSKAGSS
ncbi:hypothetical protein F2Q69_00037383 [Brassica cretica]|uniref:Uncharacterized protein n=1 Tax=Brassica cretica TaxID=69181 RepID=A0A8S9SM54_BRACR|nr:hypothetical protein F2Q69_00037383 [Brassica cretica]